MAEQPSSQSDMDLEKGRQDSEKEDVENPQQQSSQDSLRSGFSESHMKGVRGSTPDLSRVNSRRLEHVQTTASSVLSTIRARKPRPEFSHPLTNEQTAADAVVDFEGPDDPYKPTNWLFKKKVITTLLYGLTTMSTTLGSSIFSAATFPIAAEFHVGTEVALLGTAIFLFGMGLGPLLWAPLSELYGRKPAVLIPTFIAGIFAFGAGAGKDIQTIIICRFFQGMFGSAPVTNTGGALGDMWTAENRAYATVGYAMALVGGPTLGPLIGGAFVISGVGWRWIQYLTGELS